MLEGQRMYVGGCSFGDNFLTVDPVATQFGRLVGDNSTIVKFVYKLNR